MPDLPRIDLPRIVPEPWHLDRRVPLTIIATLLTAIVSGVWFAASLSGSVANHDKRLDVIAPQGERLVRVETKVDMLLHDLSELKDLLRRR